MKTLSRNEKGMTLFEVLIVTLLLAVMGMLTFNSIRETTRSKVKIERNLDSIAGVRDALHIMTRDINMAFHWRDVNEDLKNAIVSEARAANKPIPPSMAATPNPYSTKIPTEKITSFIGTEKDLHFTALSNMRTIKDSPESDQAEIGYFLRSVKTSGGGNTQALIRRTTPVLDEDVTKGGDETILLGNITQFKLAYIGDQPDDDWKSEWKSLEGLDDKTRGKFPAAVEITIETEFEGIKTKLSTIASIHMPNNEPLVKPKSSPAPGGAQNPFGQQGGG